MDKGVRERVLSVARAQLREAATDALAGALDTLESRFLAGRAATRGRGGRPVERMREVLERDRALVSATRPEDRAAPSPIPPSPPPAEPVAVACDEPIRTRSMAKLLAAQGYPERALSIYAYLLARDPADAALQAEASAVRAQLTAAAANRD